MEQNLETKRESTHKNKSKTANIFYAMPLILLIFLYGNNRSRKNKHRTVLLFIASTYCVLGHNAHACPKGVLLEQGNILAVHHNNPIRDIIEPEQKAHDCAFSAAPKEEVGILYEDLQKKKKNFIASF